MRFIVFQNRICSIVQSLLKDQVARFSVMICFLFSEGFCGNYSDIRGMNAVSTRAQPLVTQLTRTLMRHANFTQTAILKRS